MTPDFERSELLPCTGVGAIRKHRKCALSLYLLPPGPIPSPHSMSCGLTPATGVSWGISKIATGFILCSLWLGARSALTISGQSSLQTHWRTGNCKNFTNLSSDQKPHPKQNPGCDATGSVGQDWWGKGRGTREGTPDPVKVLKSMLEHMGASVQATWPDHVAKTGLVDFFGFPSFSSLWSCNLWSFLAFKWVDARTRELKVHAVPTEDQSSGPRIHVGQLTNDCDSTSRDPVLSSGPTGHPHSCPHSHAHN